MPAPATPLSDARNALLETAARLAPSLEGPEALLPERVCAEARRSLEEFRAIWPDPVAFRIDLLSRLLDEVRDTVAKSTLGMAPGLQRAKLAIEAYLEANLARHVLRSLAHELRPHPAGAAVLRQRVFGFMMMMKLELHAMGWPRTEATARLMTAAVLETAVAEFEASRALPEMRQVIFAYFNRSRS